MAEPADEVGRETSQGPGWWLASDGMWYPPELAPENRPGAKTPGGTTSGGTTAKKVVKKAVPKKVVKKAVPKKAAAPAEPVHEEPGDEDESGVEAAAPSTDQIVARRVQAKEQTSLLANDRRLAAMRALANLGDDEPALVGVGGRTIEDRGGAPDDRPTPKAKQGSARPPAAANPPPAATTLSPTPPTTPKTPKSPKSPKSPTSTPPPAAPPAAPAAPAGPPAGTHKPTKGPEPTGGTMGADVPFMEVKGSALGTDIDRIGEKILIFADRVELRDRGNTVRSTIDYDDLDRVEIHKKMLGPTLAIHARSGTEITAKALSPERASGAKAMIEKHAGRSGTAEPAPPTPLPPPPTEAMRAATTPTQTPPAPAAPPPAPVAEPAPSASRPTAQKHVLAAMLEELHVAGLLTDDELDAKQALLEVLHRD